MADPQVADTLKPNEHVRTTVRSIAALRAIHEERSTKPERLTDAVTKRLAQPASLIAIIALMLAWIVVNCLLRILVPGHPIRHPFFWLEGGASVVLLCLVILVLSRQRREDDLDLQRDLLGLELAILSERKTSKIIKLLEELRRGTPQIPDRIANEADRMARPSDTRSVVGVIQDAHLDAEKQ